MKGYLRCNTAGHVRAISGSSTKSYLLVTDGAPAQMQRVERVQGWVASWESMLTSNGEPGPGHSRTRNPPLEAPLRRIKRSSGGRRRRRRHHPPLCGGRHHVCQIGDRPHMSGGGGPPLPTACQDGPWTETHRDSRVSRSRDGCRTGGERRGARMVARQNSPARSWLGNKNTQLSGWS